MSLNYSFIIDTLSKSYPHLNKLLDFGCGSGDLAALALAKGYDAYGVDTFEGVGAAASNQSIAKEKIGSRVFSISPGESMPFETGYFDVVIANQVFEHIKDLESASLEIARVLRSGGLLFALMPTSEILWEDHLKMPWIHRMQTGSKQQRMMIKALSQIGFGPKGHVGTDEWIDNAMHNLQQQIFHRPTSWYITTLRTYFYLKNEAEPLWIQYRIEHHLLFKHFGKLTKFQKFNSILKFITRKLAGSVLIFAKA